MANLQANHAHPFQLIVHTNLYSGNFEREMTAYVTGSLGECEVGEELIPIAIRDLVAQGLTEHQARDQMAEWAELTVQLPDERRVYRPCSISPTPGYWNNGLGGHYPDSEYQSGSRYPAYQSVAIYLTRALTADEIEVFTRRVERFVHIYNTGATRSGVVPRVMMAQLGIECRGTQGS